MADDRGRLEPSGGSWLVPTLAAGILERAPDGILIVDGDGRIAYANVRAEVIFDRPRAALVGSSVDELVPAPLVEGHARYRASYLRQPSARAMGIGREPHARRADGSEVPVAVTLSPIDLGPGAGTIAVVRVGGHPAPPASPRVDARADEREHIVAELQSILARLFDAGLVLQSVIRTAGPSVEGQIDDALENLNLAIRQLQSVAFDLIAPPESDQDR